MPQPMQRLLLGEWLPDQPELANPGVVVARNCLPQATSYRSMNGLSAIADEVGADVVGAFWARGQAGAVNVLAGTQTALYRLAGDRTWTDVTRAVGGAYNALEWEFARFGTQVIAVASGNAPQVIDLTAVAPQFADLSGSPPQAARIGIVRDFVVLGDLGTDEDTIYWSGYNNETVWGDILNQSDSQRLYEGGKVQKIVGGPYGLVFQESVIRRMDYVGPDVIFNIQVVDRERGTAAPSSVVAAGDRVYFYAQDGFFSTDGRQSAPIGEERVNRWFLENCAPTEIENVIGAADRENRLVVWAFKTDAGLTANNRLLIYNYGVNKWSYAEVSVKYLAEARVAGFNLDDLDTPLPAGIDIDSILTESPAYVGGRLFLAAFSGTNALSDFGGAALPAVIETAEWENETNRRSIITGLRPSVEGTATVSASVLTRETLSGALAEVGPVATNRIGEAVLRANGRYCRIRLQTSGDFEHASAVTVLGAQGGRF
jgi:hypothetical protein